MSGFGDLVIRCMCM